MKRPARTIQQQISRLLLTVLILTGVVILLMMVMLFSVQKRYTDVLQSANTAADFHAEFKEQLDQGMYNHVIRPRSETSVAELPMDVLDDAVAVLLRLEGITTLRDNQWRVQSMLTMCETLRGYMVDIAGEGSYDERMLLLERNIRGETGLTKLIEDYMNDFVGDEVRELARIQEQLDMQMTLLTALVVVVAIVLTVGLMWNALRLSRAIVGPISALSQKVRRFGDGDLTTTQADTDITELQTLDSGFNDMARRIDALMQKQVEDQRSLHRAELELLQAQINPHFLYNTLDSIAILAECHREEDVVTMVTSLSTFFRNSLNKGADIISLEAECKQVQSYLEIQQIRYSDILEYELDIPQSLLDCQVPKLILQPLVENALYHGIKNRRGMGKITVTGEAKGSDLVLRVQDNGAGMEAEQVEELQNGIYEDKHTGLGLVNVHKRIGLYCGQPYGLSFESEKGKGSTVTVLLPQHRELPGKEMAT